MQSYTVAGTDLSISRIAYGCGSLTGWKRAPLETDEIRRAESAVLAAFEHGITLFDHADLYGFGRSETAFGEILARNPQIRDRMVIQTKCGQVFPEGGQLGLPIRVNLSAEHIVASAETSLARMRCGHIDILLLHAPSALMRPDEVAKAFDLLHADGKVRHFGVSNFNAAQIALLQRSVRQPLRFNQVRIGLGHPELMADGLEFSLNVAKGRGYDIYPARTGAGTFDYCRLNDVRLQAWSPLGACRPGNETGEAPHLPAMRAHLAALAAAHSTTPTAMALAWLLHHPAGIVPVIGSVTPANIIDNVSADTIRLSDDEWYDLFASAAQPMLGHA